MEFSLVYDNVRWEEKAILKAAVDRNHRVNMINVKTMDMDFDAELQGSYGRISLQRCTSYYRGLHSTAYLECKGQRVINDLHVQLIAGNKMFTSLALVKNHVPTPRTSASTSYAAAIDQFYRKFGDRAVLKPVTGSWGRMVALMNDKEAAMAVLEDREYMYPIYSIFYLQEFIKRPPRDIRAFVTGDRVAGAIFRYAADGDWRTNSAIGGEAEKCEVTPELEDIVIRAAKSVGYGIFGVDVMESENGYLVHEVNSTTEFKNTARAGGIDIPSMIVDFMEEEAR